MSGRLSISRRGVFGRLRLPWLVGLWTGILVLLVSFGMPSQPMPFEFKIGTHLITDNRAVLIAKLDSLGTEHAIVLENVKSSVGSSWNCDVHGWSPDGLYSRTKLISLPGRIADARARDLDGDGIDECIVACVTPELYRMHVLALDLESLEEIWRDSITTDVRTCDGREYDNGLSIGPVLGSAVNGGRGLIIALNAAYCKYPRGLILYNALTGDSVWSIFNSSQVAAHEMRVTDMNGDQQNDILCFGFGPGNGTEQYDIGDFNSQLFAVNLQGEYLWRNIWPYASSGTFGWIPLDSGASTAFVLRYCVGSSDARNYLGKVNLENGSLTDSVVFDHRCKDNFLWPMFADSIHLQEFIVSVEPGMAGVFNEHLQLKRTVAITGWLRQAFDIDSDHVNEFVMLDRNHHLLVDSSLSLLADFGKQVGNVQFQKRKDLPPLWWIEADDEIWRTELVPNPEFGTWRRTVALWLTLWIIVSLTLAVICVESILLYMRNRAMSQERTENEISLRSANAVMRHLHHVLDTPLDAIGFTVSNIEREIVDRAPELDPVLSNLQASIGEKLRQCRRSIEIVRRYADPSRYKWEEIDLRSLIAAVLADRISQQKGITIITDRSDESDCTIRGDRMQIEELVICIFKNAQAAMRDVPTPRFDFSVGHTAPAKFETETGYVYLAFHDNGRGMTEEERSRAFESGYSGWDGSGFGLAFVKTTVEAHHGNVLPIQSESGSGTQFTFAFPSLEGRA